MTVFIPSRARLQLGKLARRRRGFLQRHWAADFAVSATIMGYNGDPNNLRTIGRAQFLRCSEMQVWSKQTFTVHFWGPEVLRES